jgi:hypothetical protein
VYLGAGVGAVVDTEIIHAVVLAALLVLAGCTMPKQAGMQSQRMFARAVGSEGGGGM